MKTLIAIFLLLLTPVIGQILSEEDYMTLNKQIARGAYSLQENSDQGIDTAIKILRNAFFGNAPSNQSASNEAVAMLTQEGEQLKQSIASLQTSLAAYQKQTPSPALIILELSELQATSFAVYKWIWKVTETVDVANGISKTSEAGSGAFFTALLQVHEAIQTVSTKRIREIAILSLQK